MHPFLHSLMLYERRFVVVVVVAICNINENASVDNLKPSKKASRELCREARRYKAFDGSHISQSDTALSVY